jgi:hypothetical protein
MSEQIPTGSVQPPPSTPQPIPPTQVNALASLALNMALLGIGLAAVIIGHKARKELREWKDRWPQQKGNAQALWALWLGYIQSVVWSLFWVAVIAGVVTGDFDSDIIDEPSSSELAELRSECEAGVLFSCDRLFIEAPPGSEDERFGETCGGRETGENWCSLEGEEEFGGEQ